MSDSKFFAGLAALLVFAIIAVVAGNATWTGAYIGLGVLAVILVGIVLAA